MDETVNENDDHSGQESNEWSEEEVRGIISKVVQTCGSKIFGHEVKKLNWANLRIEGRDAEACKALFLNLTQKIRKHRTMAEILNDVTESLTKSVANVNKKAFSKPLTGYFMYIKEKDLKLKEKHPDLPRKDRLSRLLKRWNKSESLRAQYQEKYKILYDEYKAKVEKMEESNPKGKVKKRVPKVPTAFGLFCSKKRAAENEKNPEMDSKQVTALLKSKYNKLSDKKKFRLMNKAMEEMSEYKKEVEAYKLNHPDFEAKSESVPLTKEEKNILNDRFPRPVPLPINVYLYYCSKERPKLRGDNVADHSRQLAASYSKLEAHAKSDYETEFKKCVEDHIEKLHKYKDQITPWCDKTAQEMVIEIEKYQKTLVTKKKKERKSRAKIPVENGECGVVATVKSPHLKRTAEEALKEEDSSSEETPNKPPAAKKQKTPKESSSKSLFNKTSPNLDRFPSEELNSDSDISLDMAAFSKFSPLKSPKKVS